MRVWRLIKRRRRSTAFDGEGARLAGGRWNPPGVAVVYTSEHLSLAALEILVHVDTEDAPEEYVAIPLHVADTVRIREIGVDDLPSGWRASPPPGSLQGIGAGWVVAADTPVLAVPSAIVPHERNFLVNPAHPESRRLTIGEAEPFSFDPRLW